MEIISHLNLLKRHTAKLIIIILIAITAGTTIGLNKKSQSYLNTTFINIGAQTNDQILDSVEASDKFTETIQGWFRNPKITNKINQEIKTNCKTCNENINISASKQEKQNLILTFKSTTETNAEKEEQAIKTILQNEINQYNKSTNSTFKLTIFETTTTKASNKLYLYIIISFIVGIIIAIIAVYLFEGYFGLISHKWQIEKILKRKTDDTIKNNQVENQNISYILALLKKEDHKKIIITGIGFLPEKLEKNLMEGLPKKEIETIIFPENAITLSSNENKNIVIAIKPGTSKLEDLKKLKKLLPKNYISIIIE